MAPFDSGLILIAWLAASPLAAQESPSGQTNSSSSTNAQTSPAVSSGELRTFTIEKPRQPGKSPAQVEQASAQPPNVPRRRANLETTVGVGYVQGADWGVEALANGTFAGLQVQLDSLITRGTQGTRFDHGTLLLFDPDKRWGLESGDLFSSLRGASRGLRVSWLSGRWAPSFVIYNARPGFTDRRTRIGFGNTVRLGEPLQVDGEIASNGSHYVRSRLNLRRVEFDTSYRRVLGEIGERDGGSWLGIRLWRDIGVSTGLFQSYRAGSRSDWRTIAIRLPTIRALGVTLERTFSKTTQSTDTSSAAMVSFTAGRLRLFHRQMWGHADIDQAGFGSVIDRTQLQSLASYGVGPRLNLTVQMASQWSADNRVQHWEELQAMIRLTRLTGVYASVPLQQFSDTRRLRVQIDQRLPQRFSLVAEYGRLSAFQLLPSERDDPRFKLMIRKTWDTPTPARGGQVRGRVVDQLGRAVPGARVKLGSYATNTDGTGGYAFVRVPAGTFDLSLDESQLPADYAWDGRQVSLPVTVSTRAVIDLLVAPLNAIHGRVYCDRNRNNQFDPGEGVAGAVIRLGEHATATDEQGSYDFYNVWPGTHLLQLDRTKLPSEFELTGSPELTVELRDDRPVTAADFRVSPKLKPVIWQGSGRDQIR